MQPHGLFVVGCPRSGTTLLQSLIAAHPKVTSFPESNFFAHNFRRLPKTSLYYMKQNPEGQLFTFIRKSREAPARYQANLTDLSKTQRLWPPSAITAGTHFLALLSHIAASRRAEIWLEKSPVHLWFLPLIDKIAERAKQHVRAIHIVRDGRDVVASLYGASRFWHGNEYSVKYCIKRWNDDLRATIRRMSSDTRDVVVFYEDIAERPADTLRPLFGALSIPWDDRVLTKYKEVADQIGATSKPYHQTLQHPIKASSKFNEIFDESQREAITKHLDLDAWAALRARCSA